MLRISTAVSLALFAGLPANAQLPDNPAATAPVAKVQTDAYLRPGRMVTVEKGRRLNLLCMGRGAPTVLLESGAGIGAVAWRPVQAAIAQFTHVCAYDRAGYGFSDPISRPSTAANLEDDLHKLVVAAKLKGPLVLVGHSAGGIYAQMFATDYPAWTAGVVLVAASGRNSERYVWQILTEQERAGTTRGARAAKANRDGCLVKARAGMALEKSCSPLLTGDLALDSELARQRATVKVREALNSEMDNFESIDGTGEGSVSLAQAIAKPFKLGDKPLIQLSSSGGGPPGERGERLKALTAEENRLILEASSQSKRVIVPGAGHVIQDDRPDAVVSAIQEIVDRIRKGPAPGSRRTVSAP